MKKLILWGFLAFSPLFFFNAYCGGNQTETGVVINGVRWATRNVAAPGTFATNPEDAGMFYQWNSKIGWPVNGSIGSIIATDGSTAWNSNWTGGYANPSSSDTWITANDPSPVGWRVPTYAEVETLFDDTKVSSIWIKQNWIYGEKFTDKTTGNFIFLPAFGSRNNDGTLDVASDGDYWSSTVPSCDNGSFTFDCNTAERFDVSAPNVARVDTTALTRALGFTIRSVAK